ncbi:hypothetical protein RvY_03296 [Ramazzottius varieornatus]|uniref:Invertebrate defensins family profile domain-containing protein n=1 Tax=Ramazzottius varieornatus TaxID=947166 RepID=A0A1D1UMJ0_RAMVA|nr:hypothetical protein RvY_03296 [Ramazzottius varieornatus]
MIRMAGQSPPTTLYPAMALLLTLFLLMEYSGAVAGGAGEGCSRFCRATGFAGSVGNCACGLSLFAKRTGLPLANPRFSLEDWEEVERKRRSVPTFDQDKTGGIQAALPSSRDRFGSQALPQPPP